VKITLFCLSAPLCCPSFSMVFLFCIYCFQTALHHLGITRDIYRSCTLYLIYQFTIKVLRQDLYDTFWSVARVNFLWILLELLWSYFWRSLWCWPYFIYFLYQRCL
jgi:hypothetical protein